MGKEEFGLGDLQGHTCVTLPNNLSSRAYAPSIIPIFASVTSSLGLPLNTALSQPLPSCQNWLTAEPDWVSLCPFLSSVPCARLWKGTYGELSSVCRVSGIREWKFFTHPLAQLFHGGVAIWQEGCILALGELTFLLLWAISDERPVKESSSLASFPDLKQNEVKFRPDLVGIIAQHLR